MILCPVFIGTFCKTTALVISHSGEMRIELRSQRFSEAPKVINATGKNEPERNARQRLGGLETKSAKASAAHPFCGAAKTIE